MFSTVYNQPMGEEEGIVITQLLTLLLNSNQRYITNIFVIGDLNIVIVHLHATCTCGGYSYIELIETYLKISSSLKPT